MNIPKNIDQKQKIAELTNKFSRFSETVLAERKKREQNVASAHGVLPPWTGQQAQLFPPFTYFGGKRRIASYVWRRLGENIPNYIEPFGGGLSVLLARPAYDLNRLEKRRELVNDANVLLQNFWRSVQQNTIDVLVDLLDFPAFEMELLSRRKEMMRRLPELANKILDPKFHDPEIAAYWLYVQRQWIGAGSDDAKISPIKKMIRARESGGLGDDMRRTLNWLRLRTRHVRFHCTPDWSKWLRTLISDTQTGKNGMTGVFLDSPYIETTDYYSGNPNSGTDSERVPFEVGEWALENGRRPDLRIAHCGYLHHFEGFFPETGPNAWSKISWAKSNGYSKPGKGKAPQIDTIWFSPNCLKVD